MCKYQWKGPISKNLLVVEAFQMTKERYRDKSKWPSWLQIDLDTSQEIEVGEMIRNFPSSEILIRISLDEGFLGGYLSVGIDDWIIKGIQGKLYPCKPDIFEAAYEVITDDEFSTVDCPAHLGLF